MGLYEQIRFIAKQEGYSINKLEQELGFARSSINKYNKNIPSIDKLQKIADFLEVPVEYFIEEEGGLITCKYCGLFYDSSYPEDIEQHKKQHLAWEKATKKFGEIYGNYAIRERIKAKNRNIRDDENNTIDERYDAELKVLRCLFSRSVQASGYDLNHVTFEKYVAMIMHGKKYRKHLGNELYQKIVDNFGTMPGINDGETYYHVPNFHPHNIASHLDVSDLTDTEIENVKDYIEFIRNKRK